MTLKTMNLAANCTYCQC